MRDSLDDLYNEALDDGEDGFLFGSEGAVDISDDRFFDPPPNVRSECHLRPFANAALPSLAIPRAKR